MSLSGAVLTLQWLLLGLFLLTSHVASFANARLHHETSAPNDPLNSSLDLHNSLHQLQLSAVETTAATSAAVQLPAAQLLETESFQTLNLGRLPEVAEKLPQPGSRRKLAVTLEVQSVADNLGESEGAQHASIDSTPSRPCRLW